jgi:hypothetical protein
MLKRLNRVLCGMVALLPLATALEAQRTGKLIALSPPEVRVSATPLTVTVTWRPVDGAASYTVEQALAPTGPWSSLPMRPLATQVTAPTSPGASFGGTLYYYKVTALPPLGEPGATVVARVTPQLDQPLGVSGHQEGADLLVSWAPVPYATGYVVTAAFGPQLPPSQTTEVGPQSTEARLINLASPTAPRSVWIGVNARYGTGGAVSIATPKKITVAGAQACWPPSSVPGPAPVLSISALGPTTISITTQNTLNGLAVATRVERAPAGSQTWESVGCGFTGVGDENLVPGTQYQYRVNEIGPAGTVGQAIATVATPPVPDNPTPAASVSGCSATGCQVTLSWSHVAGAENYRIESSYGMYRPIAMAFGGVVVAAGSGVIEPLGQVPAGVHTFFVTALFPSMRPSPRPPGQVTVVVP